MPFQKVQMTSISSKKSVIIIIIIILGLKNRDLKKKEKKSVNNRFELCFLVHFHPLWTFLLLTLFIH
jgi:hypothetical protein